MNILIFGGSACGKSAYAEDLAAEMARKEGLPLYYVATLDKNSGGDTPLRIEKHRKMRESKGFVTYEQPKDLSALKIEGEKGVILLEDIGNLVANELFTSKTPPVSIDRHDANTNYAVKTRIRREAHSAAALSASTSVYADAMARKIADSIANLAAQSVHLIAVSNNVFEEPTAEYSADTHIFLQTLAVATAMFASNAAGIPIALKKLSAVPASSER